MSNEAHDPHHDPSDTPTPHHDTDHDTDHDTEQAPDNEAEDLLWWDDEHDASTYEPDGTPPPTTPEHDTRPLTGIDTIHQAAITHAETTRNTPPTEGFMLEGTLVTPPTPHDDTPHEPEHPGRTLDRVRQVATTAWKKGPGRAEPLAWWVAETIWAHPVVWAAFLTGLVWFTRLRPDHVAVTACFLAMIALGPANRGATKRRDRFVSLRAVGAYRQHRRRVKQRWDMLWANAGLQKPALTPHGSKRQPTLKRVRPHRDGITLYLSGAHVGVGVAEILTATRSLTVTMGAKTLRVVQPEGRRDGGGPVSRVLPVRGGGDLLAVTFKFRDPFPARNIRLEELPAPSRRGSVVIGLDEERRGLEKSLMLPSLIVGAPGSGKSSEVWTTLRALRLAGIPFRLRVFDPKGGLELGDLKDAAFRYESVPSRWPRFLEQACEALRVRQEIMSRRGLRKVPEPSEEFPLDIMLIDELVTVLAMSRGKEALVRVFGQETSAYRAFLVYLSQIRASLGSCIALSQVGTKDVLGPIRGMFPYISVLRVGQTEKELVDVMLGQGAHNAYPAHLLDPADPLMAGRGWVRTKGGILAYRAAFMEDCDRAEEARLIGLATERFRRGGQQDPDVPERVKVPVGRPAKAARASAGPVGPVKRVPPKPAQKAAPKAAPRVRKSAAPDPSGGAA